MSKETEYLEDLLCCPENIMGYGRFKGDKRVVNETVTLNKWTMERINAIKRALEHYDQLKQELVELKRLGLYIIERSKASIHHEQIDKTDPFIRAFNKFMQLCKNEPATPERRENINE